VLHYLNVALGEIINNNQNGQRLWVSKVCMTLKHSVCVSRSVDEIALAVSKISETGNKTEENVCIFK